jgi:hypothetical protein
MSPVPAALQALLLSVQPGGCAPHLDRLRARGVIVRVASEPGDALVLLRRRPQLVLVDLVHGPGLNASVVAELNRTPRTAHVVALHDGCIDSHLDQVEHLAVDGFSRLESDALAYPPAD